MFIYIWQKPIIGINNQKTILLVEDDNLTSGLQGDILKTYGYHILLANSGENAIETIKNVLEIDLVLMDIDLGKGIDGAQTAEIILKIREIPIVFLSSHTEPEIVEKIDKITSYGYVQKISNITVLNASIKMAFRLFEAKRQIIEIEQKHRAIFENAPLGIFRSTTEGEFIEVNSALSKMLGYDSPETVLREIHNIAEQVYVRSDDRQPIVEKQLQISGMTQHHNHYRRADGSEFFANLYLNTIKDETGQPLYFEGIVEDITERKQSEEMLNKTNERLLLATAAGI